MFKKTAVLASVVSLVLAVAATAAFAGNGPNKTPSSSWIGLTSTGAAGTTSVARGSTVTLYEGTTATTQPFIHLTCSQNGSLVLEAWKAVFTPNTGSATFTLSSPAWQSGAATCSASLENWDSYSNKGRTTTLATTSFDASA